MNLENSQIARAIDATTGPGDWVPNAHRVKSYLGYLQPPGDPLPVDYGESFDQIARYIWLNYGVKTVLSSASEMSLTNLQGEYYIRRPDSYKLTEEESESIRANNFKLVQDQTINKKVRKSRVRHYHP